MVDGVLSMSRGESRVACAWTPRGQGGRVCSRKMTGALFGGQPWEAVTLGSRTSTGAAGSSDRIGNGWVRWLEPVPWFLESRSRRPPSTWTTSRRPTGSPTPAASAATSSSASHTPVALSALWLNQVFPRADAAREVLYPLRMVFGAAMLVTIVLGVRRGPSSRLRSSSGVDDPQLRDRPRRRHSGLPTRLRRGDLRRRKPADCAARGCRLAINLAVAERQIRKRPRRGTPAAPVQMPLP